jgi:very-short-patch-repair endonuclease
LETESEWVSDAKGVYSIPVTAETRDLILNNSDGSAAHYYGYPVLAQWQSEEKLMKFVPVLIWKLDRIGNRNETSHRLSFALDAKEVRLNPEVLWSVQYRQRKRIIELFQNAKTLQECLELIQADFLGHEVKEILFTRRLPKNPQLTNLREKDEGIYNRGLYLSVTPNSYVKGLATELKLLGDVASGCLPPTSLDAFFNNDAEALSDEAAIVPVSRPLNAYQEAEVDRALKSRLSVVTGPPGTGKSEVVVAIIANAILQKKSVLFASRNNGAISVVQERVEKVLGHGKAFFRLGGDYDSDTKNNVRALLNQPTRSELLAKKEGADKYDTAYADLESILATILNYENATEKARQAEKSYDEALADLELNKETLPNSFDAELLASLESLVSQVQTAEWLKKLPLIGAKLFRGKLDKLDVRESATIQELALKLGVSSEQFIKLAGQNECTWSQFILKAIELLQASERAVDAASALKKLEPLETLYDHLMSLKEALCEHSPDKFAYYLNELLTTKSRETEFKRGAQQFNDLLGKKQNPHIDHPMEGVLGALPCWAISNLSVAGRLPLTPALFDLVIIDESSQCDISSCIPLMFRAKQAVIIGDPMQLGSITNLASQTEEALLKRHKVSHPGAFRYSGNSIYDLAATSTPTESQTFLAQHYRCHPDIIDFANSSHWYDSNLEPVTDARNLKKPSNLKLGISWLEVNGSLKHEQTGVWIPEEVEHITQQVVRLLNEERFEGTVGVVTPFRRMANALQESIERSGIHHATLEASQFRADTAHKFQGDERDIMFYAPCFHPDMPNKHKWFLSSQKNVFNVALSRAKSAFVVVGSKEAMRTSEIDYLEDFVEYADRLQDREPRKPKAGSVQKGHWEPILEARLREEGLPVQPQYSLGPYWLDFALIKGDRRLNIEVDGEQFHKNESGMRCQKDIDRNIYVKAQGWTVMRFWVYQLRDDIDSCVSQIKSWWTQTN